MRKIFILITFLFLVEEAFSLSPSKILPNNPFYVFKKTFYDIKLKIIKDEEKKFQIIFKNYKQIYFDFKFIVENLSPTDTFEFKKPLSEVKKNFLNLKEYTLFKLNDQKKIREVADFIFEVINTEFKERENDDILEFKNLNKEFFLNLLSRLDFEASFDFLILTLNKEKINDNDIFFIFQIKEILKEKKEYSLWEDNYLTYFKPEKFKDLIFKKPINISKFDLIFDYWKKILIEKEGKIQDFQKEIEILKEHQEYLNLKRGIENLAWFLNKLEDKSKKKFENILKDLSEDEANFVDQFWEIFISIIQEILSPKISCNLIWDPVCGVDGKTYSNICFLEAAKVKLAYFGSCINISDLEKLEELKEQEDSELDEILKEFNEEGL